MKCHFLKTLVVVGSLFAAAPALAAPGDILKTYTLPNAQPDDYFGWSATSYCGSILATAPEGRVYVINPSSGAAKLLQRPSHINYVGFGEQVLVHGSRLYITDPYVNIDGYPGEGAVFVYNSLEDNDPLIIPNPADKKYDLFGTYIDANLAGDLIIGCPNFVNDQNNTVGRVYVYAPSATSPRLTLTGTLVNWLGQVAISDTGRFAITNNVEFVYLYNLHDGSYYTTLQPTSPNMAGAGFGINVVFIGDNVYTVDPSGGFSWEENEWSSAVYRFDAATGALVRGR